MHPLKKMVLLKSYLELGGGIRWGTEGKTIYHLNRDQHDDEPVTSGQIKHITDKKIDMNIITLNIKSTMIFKTI